MAHRLTATEMMVRERTKNEKLEELYDAMILSPLVDKTVAQAIAAGSIPFPIMGDHVAEPKATPTDLISMRLYKGERKFIPFDFIVAVQVKDKEKYFVFIINKGEALTLEDDLMFPSDALITKLRVLLDG
jgi:hypothetical protein